MKRLVSMILSVCLIFGVCGFNAVYAENEDSEKNTVEITADKTAQWTAREKSNNFDLRIHGWEGWENAAYVGFTLPNNEEHKAIKKAELVINTVTAKNDGNRKNYPYAWLYAAEYDGFENASQYEGVNDVPAYNDEAILEFESPTGAGVETYDVTSYMQGLTEEYAAFRIDVKSQNSNNAWTIGSCNNGNVAPKLVITYADESKPEATTSVLPSVSPSTVPSETSVPSEEYDITADKTAQWIANANDSKSYNLDIHGYESWETAAYMGFTLPDDFNAADIAEAKLIVNTKSAKNSGNGRAYAAYYTGFDNGGYTEGIDHIPGYINTDTMSAIAKFETPTKAGDFEIDVSAYVHNLDSDTKNVAFRIDAETSKVDMRWQIGSCSNGTAPRLVLKKGEYIEPTPAPTEEPLIEPDAPVTENFVNLDFSDGLNGWTTSQAGESVGKVTVNGNAVVLGSNASVYQKANGLKQGSYTINVWVKGNGTGNTSYIRAEDTGSPISESKIDTYINNSSYTCVTLRNVLIYNGQCKIKVFSGKNCELTIDKIEFTMDSDDDNPVTNWGFEDGLNGWNIEGTADIISDADAGNKAVKLAPNSQISQTVSVEPNTRYFATVRAKVDTQSTWHTVYTTYQEGPNAGKKSGEYSVTDTIGDRVNLGVKNVDNVVLRQAPAGLEGYSLLTISFVTGENDHEVTLYANTIHDEAYDESVAVYDSSKAAYPQTTTGDTWTGNTGNAYIDSFDFFSREEDVIMGADVSYLPIIERNNGKYYANGVQQDFLRILSNRGVTTVNGMIFVRGGGYAITPNSATKRYNMPNGFDKYYWYEIAERAKALNMDYMVNFMFSDVWMNAVTAFMPQDWMRYNKENGVYSVETLDELKTTMYNYVRDFMEGLKERDITPIAVKIGNEEDNGICYPTGQFDRWKWTASEGFKELIGTAYDASHDVFPDITGFLHTYEGYDIAYAKKWFEISDNANVKYDGRAYSLYGASPTYNILAMLNQDNNVAPYADTIHVETGYQATYYDADNLGNDTSNVQAEYWNASPNGQYNYFLEYLQAMKDIPNPHSVMRGAFWWAAEWMEVDGAGYITNDGNSVAGRTLVNNGDKKIHEQGSTADGKAGDVYESTYAYLWRGEAKNKSKDTVNPLKRYGSYSVEALDAPTSITIDDDYKNITLTEGEFKKIHTTLAPANSLYNWNIIWTSSNESVAVVGEKGTVKAVGEGTAQITATTESGGLTAVCTVTVLPSVKAEKKEDIDINVEAYGQKLKDDESLGMLTDNALKLNITLPEAVTDKTVKIISSNPNVVRFLGEHWEPNAEGVLYQQTDNTDAIELNAKSVGTSVITVSAGNVSKQFTVNVTDTVSADIEKLYINKTELELERTFTEKLSVTVYPQNAAYSGITWKSSNSDIAAVDENGKVTALKVGTAIITATAGEVSASCNVTVKPTSQIEKKISGVTPDDDDIYRFPTGDNTLTADFRASSGKITIEFDVQLLQNNGGKYSEFDIKDNDNNTLIHWGCYEYNDGTNAAANQLKVGDYETSGFDKVSKGISLGRDASSLAFTHFNAVIDLDSKTAELYAGSEMLGKGNITSENIAKLTIFSNHSINGRTINVKNISIVNKSADEPHIESLTASLENQNNINYDLNYIGTENSAVYIALYNEQNVLISCSGNKSGSFKVPQKGTYTVKAFLWENMKPLDGAAEQTIKYE